MRVYIALACHVGIGIQGAYIRAMVYNFAQCTDLGYLTRQAF